MNRRRSWRRAGVPRVVLGVGLTVATIAMFLPACGGDVVVDTRNGKGTGAGGSSTSNGGSASTMSAGGAGAGGGTCTLTTSGTGGGDVITTECFAPPGAGCPNEYQASQYIVPMGCSYLVGVRCGPVTQGGQCCYLAVEQPNTCHP